MAIKIFTNLTEDDTGRLSSKISEGLFTNGVGELTAFFTSSAQVTSLGNYTINVNQEATSSTTSATQFSISYGHYAGSGSTVSNDEKPTKAIYSQYKNLLLESDDTRFTFNGVDSDHIIVMNIKRGLFKENIDPGNWQITFTSASNSITVTDDSLQSLGAGNVSNISVSGKKFYSIVSGSIANGPLGATAAAYKHLGIVYQELGLFVFNPNAINTELSMSAASSSFITQSTNSTPAINNNQRFHDILKAGASFKARNEETLNSQHYFIRVKSKEYNFSNNPTYVTGSVGKIIDAITKRGVPLSYVTGIGLYNDSNQLLATAKLSKPLFKQPGTEALIKIRLDF